MSSFTFTQQFKNARTAVLQIREGEWIPRYNRFSLEHLTAFKGHKRLWIGNGAFFCEIDGGYFGIIWRHYVWWAAARKLKRDADRITLDLL